MRQDKTLKIVANHYLMDKPFCELVPMAGQEKANLWVASDFSEGKAMQEKFAIRFTTVELLNNFKENFNKAREFNKYLKAGETSKLVMAPVIIEKKEEPKPETKKEESTKETPKETKKEATKEPEKEPKKEDKK